MISQICLVILLLAILQIMFFSELSRRILHKIYWSVSVKRLYVFDMDGTLLPNTTAMIQIAKITGHHEDLDFLEKQYWKKEIDNMHFARTLYDLWKDLTPDIVKRAFQESPKIRNIGKVLQKLISMGNISCLITAAPNFSLIIFMSMASSTFSHQSLLIW